jgi:hypothetical protein
LFVEFVDTVWLVDAAPQYFKTRDPKALAYLPQLLPAPSRRLLDRRINNGKRQRAAAFRRKRGSLVFTRQ